MTQGCRHAHRVARCSLALLAAAVTLAPIASVASGLVVHPADTGVWRTVLHDSVANKDYVAGTSTSGTHGEFTTGPGSPPAGTGSFHQHIGSTGADGQRVESSRWNGFSLTQLTQLGYSTFVTTTTHSLSPALNLMVDLDGDGVMTQGVDVVMRFEPRDQNGSLGGTPNQCAAIPGCVAAATWQTWDAKDGAWIVLSYLGSVSYPADTLAHFQQTHPLAKLTNDRPSLNLSAGFGATEWVGFDANFDAVNVNGSVYDFEDPPAPPVIAAPTPNAVIRSDTVTISGTAAGESGTAQPGVTVTISSGSTTLGTAISSPAGAWSLAVSLPDGAYTVSATASTRLYTSAPSTRSFIVQFAPTITSPPEGSTSYSSIVTVSGSAGSGQTITLTEGSTSLGTAATALGCTAPCLWSIGPLSFSEASHTITATASTGSATSAPTSRSFSVNIQPVITSPAAGTYPTHALTVSGTAGPNMTIAVAEAATTLGTATTPIGCIRPCSWSLGTLTFAEGAHTISATATEGSQTSHPATQTFVVDTTAPPAPVINVPAEGAVVSTTSVTISGTAEANSQVDVFEGATPVGAVFVSSFGTWSIHATFPAGSHTIVATAKDSVGNTSPPTPGRTFTVSVVIPNAPVVTSPTEGSSVHSPVTISGTAPSGSNVTVFEGPVTFGSVPATNGTWSMSVGLIDGAHAVQAFDTDANGNASANSNTRHFTVDNSPPLVAFNYPGRQTGFLQPAPSSIFALGGYATDNVSVDHITLTYTDVVTGMPALIENASCSGCPGSFATFTDDPSLPPSVYRVVAVAHDGAGNASGPARTYLIVLP